MRRDIRFMLINLFKMVSVGITGCFMCSFTALHRMF